MGRRGPQPKPTAVKKLLGNPGRRRLRDDEPAPPPGEISAPDFVQPEAMGYWDSLAPLLAAMRVLTTADTFALGRLCNLYLRYKILNEYLMRKGATGTTYAIKDQKGKPKAAAEVPQAWEYRQIHNMILTHERELGLTPAARTRLRVEQTVTPVKPEASSPADVVGHIGDFCSGGGPAPARRARSNGAS